VAATFKTESTDENLQIALAGPDKVLISDRPQNRLLIYSTAGKPLGQVSATSGRWAFATDAANRTGPLYGDTETPAPAVVQLGDKSIPMFCTESFRKQEWMIWGGSGQRRNYTPTHTAVTIVDGGRSFNRPLYGDHSDSLVVAGDKPQIMLLEIII